MSLPLHRHAAPSESEFDQAQDGYRAGRQVTDLMQGEDQRRKMLVALQQQQAKLRAAGISASMMPTIHSQMSIDDIKTAQDKLNKLAPSRDTLLPAKPASPVKSAPAMQPIMENGTQIGVGKAPAVTATPSVFDLFPGANQAPVSTQVGNPRMTTAGAVVPITTQGKMDGQTVRNVGTTDPRQIWDAQFSTPEKLFSQMTPTEKREQLKLHHNPGVQVGQETVSTTPAAAPSVGSWMQRADGGYDLIGPKHGSKEGGGFVLQSLPAGQKPPSTAATVSSTRTTNGVVDPRATGVDPKYLTPGTDVVLNGKQFNNPNGNALQGPQAPPAVDQLVPRFAPANPTGPLVSIAGNGTPAQAPATPNTPAAPATSLDSVIGAGPVVRAAGNALAAAGKGALDYFGSHTMGRNGVPAPAVPPATIAPAAETLFGNHDALGAVMKQAGNAVGGAISSAKPFIEDRLDPAGMFKIGYAPDKMGDLTHPLGMAGDAVAAAVEPIAAPIRNARRIPSKPIIPNQPAQWMMPRSSPLGQWFGGVLDDERKPL